MSLVGIRMAQEFSLIGVVSPQPPSLTCAYSADACTVAETS